MASVTTTDIATSVAGLPAAPATGTIGFVTTGGKATQYVYLTTASGASANGWYRVSGV